MEGKHMSGLVLHEYNLKCHGVDSMNFGKIRWIGTKDRSDYDDGIYPTR